MKSYLEIFFVTVESCEFIKYSNLIENSPGDMFRYIIGSKSQLLFTQILPTLAMKLN